MIYNEPMKYKQICELMGEEPIKNSTSKKNQQIRNWRQYYEIEKDGMYFTIKRKYKDNELDLIETEGKYASYIKDLLIQYLVKTNKHEITLSYYDIYEITAMVNKTYHIAKNNMYRKTKYNEINKFNIEESSTLLSELDVTEKQYIEAMLNVFFHRSSRILKQNINNALDIMERESLILYDKTFILYKQPIQHTEPNGDVWYENLPSHICNDKERALMLDYRKESLIAAGLKNMQDLIFCSHKVKELYNQHMLNCVQKLGYDYYGDAIKLILGEKGLKRELKYINNKINTNVQEQLTCSLRKDINDYLLSQMNNDYIKI